MRKIYIYLLFFIYTFLSCSVQNKKLDDKDVIFVSILPQKFVVNKLAKGVFNVEVMLPPGSSPHVYEPTPSQIRKLSQAKAYIRIGHVGFEKVWMDKFSSTNPEMELFDQSFGVNFIKNEDEIDHNSPHSHTSTSSHGVEDPHIWLSAREMGIQADNITAFLIKLKPDSIKYFQANLNKFKEEIANIDKKISRMLSKTKRKSFMIYHPALAYFARDYNLDQLVLEFEGKEPSGKYMAELIKLTKNKAIKTIFIQRELPIERAQILANELDARVQILNPLDYDWSANMLSMATKIQNALNE